MAPLGPMQLTKLNGDMVLVDASRIRSVIERRKDGEFLFSAVHLDYGIFEVEEDVGEIKQLWIELILAARAARPEGVAR
jgi:hypothetical protein